MHELAIVEQVVAIAEERSGGAQVTRLVLEIGMLSAVSPDAVRFCFDLATEGTRVHGAELVIREIPGKAQCRACAQTIELLRPFGRCLCGGSDLDWLAGEELHVREIEVRS